MNSALPKKSTEPHEFDPSPHPERCYICGLPKSEPRHDAPLTRADPPDPQGWRTRLIALRAASRMTERLVDMSLDGAAFGTSGPGGDPEQLERAFQNHLKALRDLTAGIT